jgi:hypothetical protein
MMPSPQDSNGGEMQPYGMRNMPGGMPPGPNPMVNKNSSFLIPISLIIFFSQVSRPTSSSYAINATGHLSSWFNKWYLLA